jgi:hypothetical protein
MHNAMAVAQLKNAIIFIAVCAYLMRVVAIISSKTGSGGGE